MLKMRSLWLISMAGLLGCSSMERVINFPQQPAELKIEDYNTAIYKAETSIFTPIDIRNKINVQKSPTKIDSLYIIIDEKNTSNKILKQNILTEILLSIPTASVNVQIWSLGKKHESYALPDHIKISHQNLSNIQYDFSYKLSQLSERILRDGTPAAVIIIKDFQSYTIEEQDVLDLLRLKANTLTRVDEKYKEKKLMGSYENLCIFAVGPGNKFPASVIDRADWCGFSTTSTEIFHGRNASHFLEKIIYGVPLDSDQDGVPDYIDQCNLTTNQQIIDQNGCSTKSE